MFDRKYEIKKTKKRLHRLSNMPTSIIKEELEAGMSRLKDIEREISKLEGAALHSRYSLVELLIAKGEVLLDLMDLDTVAIIGKRAY